MSNQTFVWHLSAKKDDRNGRSDSTAGPLLDDKSQSSYRLGVPIKCPMDTTSNVYAIFCSASSVYHGALTAPL